MSRSTVTDAGNGGPKWAPQPQTGSFVSVRALSHRRRSARLLSSSKSL